MKVIRLKVKTIILVIFLFFITIPYVFYAIGTVGYSYMNTQQKNVGIYTVGFLKIYEKWPTIKFGEGKNYFMIAMSNYNYMLEKANNSYTGSIRFNGKQGNMEQAEIARKYFKKGIALGEDDNSYINNLNGLINLEMLLGNTTKANEFIDRAIGSTDENVVVMGKVNQMVYEAKARNYDKALEIADNYKEEYVFFSGYIDVINYLKGDIDKIKVNESNDFFSYYSPDLDTMMKRRKEKKAFEYLNYINFYSKVDNYDDFKLDKINYGEISGKILVKGKPLANAEIRLEVNNGYREFVAKNAIPLYGDNYKEYQISYTDENGNFIFNNAYPNVQYDVRATIPSALRDNTSSEYKDGITISQGQKVNIDFEIEEAIKITDIKTDYKKDEIIIKYHKIPKADNYGLMITSSYCSLSVPNITTGDEIRIPLTKGSLQSFNIMGYNENNTPTPENILGTVKENEAYIQVLAFDKDRKILNQSFNQEKIKFKKKNLNYGEQLILEGKFDEGQKWLQEKLKQYPNSKEYMYPLMRIAFERGEKDFGNELINRLEEINGTGYDKAIGEGYNRYLEYKGTGSN